MSWKDWNGTRKLRPRSRVIADMSLNFLERKVLCCGHRLIRIPEENDDGTDAFMRTHRPDTTEVETGQVDFQLKATDKIETVGNGKLIRYQAEVAHLHFWYHQVFHPFILVMYDAENHRGYWVDVQAYLDKHAEEFGNALETEAATMAIHLPVSNELNQSAIDQFREILLERTNRIDTKD